MRCRGLRPQGFRRLAPQFAQWLHFALQTSVATMQRRAEFCTRDGRMAPIRLCRSAGRWQDIGARTRLCRAVEEGAMAVRRRMKAAMLTGTALGAIALGSSAAQAGGFYLHEQSAYFQGTSMAGSAAGGPSLSSMFWNPATITQQGLGLSSETSGAVIFTRSNITPTLATTATGTNITALGSS